VIFKVGLICMTMGMRHGPAVINKYLGSLLYTSRDRYMKQHSLFFFLQIHNYPYPVFLLIMLQWKNHVHNRNLSNNLIYINGGGFGGCMVLFKKTIGQTKSLYFFQIRIIALLKSTIKKWSTFTTLSKTGF